MRKISVPNTDKAALELQIKELVNGGNMAQIQSAVIQSPVKQALVAASSWPVAEQSNSSGTTMPFTNQQTSNTPFGDLHLPSAAQVRKGTLNF